MHGSDYTAANVIIGPGSKELMFLMQFVIDDIDTLIQSPSWVSYNNQSVVLDLKSTKVHTTFENKWNITPADLDGLLSKDKNQFVIFNTPANPTGSSYDENELKELAKVLNVERTIVMSDEIYNDLSFDPSMRHLSISKFLKDKTVITSAISKCHGAGGWRLGYAIIPDELSELRDVILKVASETYSAVAAPIQFAAVEAYDIHNKDLETYKLNQARILKTIGEWTYERLHQHDVRVHKPVAGFYVFPDFSNF